MNKEEEKTIQYVAMFPTLFISDFTKGDYKPPPTKSLMVVATINQFQIPSVDVSHLW